MIRVGCPRELLELYAEGLGAGVREVVEQVGGEVVPGELAGVGQGAGVMLYRVLASRLDGVPDAPDRELAEMDRCGEGGPGWLGLLIVEELIA
mgnify:CR=1 FL=1